ncbi:MAG: Heparinase II/III-like protein [Paenibacillus sp.]|nr:Heparinase II/III-like protein [Paenibacillus sp.]
MKLFRARRWFWVLFLLLAIVAIVIPVMNTPDDDDYPSIVMQDDRWAIMGQSKGSSVHVDGILDESAWGEALSLQGFTTFFDNRQVEYDTQAKLVYDSSYLYVSMTSPKGYDTHPAAERVFIVLASDVDSQTFYTVPVTITTDSHPVGISLNNWSGGEPHDRAQTFVDLVLSKKVTPVVEKQSNGSWSAEVAIPWNELGSPELRSLTELKLNIVRYYGPSSPYSASSWVPIRTSALLDHDEDRPFDERQFRLHAGVANENRLGTLFLLDAPTGEAESLFKKVQPPNARLLFKSFNEKMLAFNSKKHPDLKQSDLRLVWGTPSGMQTEVTEFLLEKQKRDYRITFSHPVVVDEGQYSLQLFAATEGNEVDQLALYTFDRAGLIAAGEQLYTIQAAAETEIVEVENKPASTEVLSLIKLIPDRVGFFAAGVPHNPQLGFRSANYAWSIVKPAVITALDKIPMDYPNEEYKETKKLVVTNAKGNQVEYPYYEDSSGKRYFLSAHLWHKQRQHVVNRTSEMAKFDKLGAARLLYAFSLAYEGWVRINDTIWNQYPMDGGIDPPFNYYGGVWERWTSQELGALRPLADAFAQIDRTNAFELLSKEVGEDVRSRIVDGMFIPSVEEVFSYPVLNHNVEYTNWIGLIQIGKALKQPRYIHEAVSRMDEFAKVGYLFDGFWKEITLSYHNQTSTGVRGTADYVKGWTDPEGYLSPLTGQRYDNFASAKLIPQIDSIFNVPNLLTYPDGSYYPINDTWAYQKAAAPLNKASLLLPAAGIAKLIRGQGGEQAQLYLQFSPNFGHDHKDPLHLSLYGEGQELLPDIGYTHTFYRQWTVSTLGHNTVVVDGKDGIIQNEGKMGGRLTAFNVFSPSGDVQAIQAHQENSYPGLAEYSREPWFVGFQDAADGAGYVVDLFRVRGGSKHEYTLNGDANRDAVMTTDIPLETYGPFLLEGNPAIIMPKQETDMGGTSDNQYYGYTFVKDVQHAIVPDGNYNLMMKTKSGAADKASLNIHGFVGSGTNRLFIGKAPSLRSTRINGLSSDTNAEAVKYEMPKMVLRKEGTNLNSQFIHVMEPYASGKKALIDKVEVLKSNELTGEAVVAVSYGDTVDIIMSSPRNEGQPLTVGDITMVGKMGFIRLEGGKVSRMYLSGGSMLRKGTDQLNGEGSYTGPITYVERQQNQGETNAFITTEAVSQMVVGRYVFVTHPDQLSYYKCNSR